MRQVSRLKALFALVTFAAASFLTFGTVNAAPMSNTSVSWTAFTSSWAPTDVRVLVSPFTFSDGAAGNIVSVAYFSTGGATAGKWVYAYQIIFTSGSGKIIAFSFMPTNHPATVIIGGSPVHNFSFHTSKPSGATEFPDFLSGGISPIDANYDETLSEASWTFPASGIQQNQNSVVFGYVSNFEPTIVQADISKISSSATLTGKPLVFAASPEPALALLFGIGLLGVGMLRRRKKMT
jgi:PEP-CTERM motif.